MDAIILVAAVVAVVWGAWFLVRGDLLGGCLAVLLAGSVFGHPFFNLRLGPVPLTADRLLWVVLLVQYAIWRRMGLAQAKPLGKAELVLCAFMGLLLVSTFTHNWQAHNARALSRFVFFFLMPVSVYWVARQSRLTERGVLTIFGFLALFGIYLSLTAIGETYQLWWLVYPKYIASATHAEFLGRGRGPFLNPIGNGFFQSVCLCAALMWWPRLSRRRAGGYERMPYPASAGGYVRMPYPASAGKLLLMMVSVLFCLGVYCTLTRAAWLGAGLGLLVIIGLTIPRSWRVPVLGTSLLAATLLATTQWQHIVAFRRDRGLSPQETAESVKLRPILAMVAWKMFLDRPLLGCGFGHYEDQSIYYLADRSTELPLEKARPFVQHNVFLALLTETGLLGMGLFVALWALWTRDAWRLWRQQAAPFWARQQALLFLSLVAVYLPNAMFHDVSLIPMFNMLLFLLAGVTAGLRHLAQGKAVCLQPRTSRLAIVGGAQSAPLWPEGAFSCPSDAKAAGSLKKNLSLQAEPTVGAARAEPAMARQSGDEHVLADGRLSTDRHRKRGSLPSSRISMLGIKLDNLKMSEAVQAIVDRLDYHRPSQICFVNAHCANIARRHQEYLDVLRRASLTFADGMGLKLAALVHGNRVRDNVNGTDLFPRLCAALSGTGKKMFLLGARPGVAEAARDWVARHYPGVLIAGCQHGYFSADQQTAVIQKIADSGADVLLVAFGVPRQELWIDRHLATLGVKVAIGVGGLFDFYSGRIPRAPLWMRRVGMEWLHRLYREPKRLWRRYLVGNPLFLILVAEEKAKQLFNKLIGVHAPANDR